MRMIVRMGVIVIMAVGMGVRLIAMVVVPMIVVVTRFMIMRMGMAVAVRVPLAIGVRVLMAVLVAVGMGVRGLMTFRMPAMMVMRRGVGASEQQPHFARIQLRGDFLARRKAGGHMGEGVRAHHRGHDLLVHRQRHVNRAALDDRRPVLVTEAMAEFKTGPQDLRRRQTLQPFQLDDQNFLQRHAGNDNDVLRVVGVQHVAVMQVLGARQ